MKNTLQLVWLSAILSILPTLIFAQAPKLGGTAGFVLFTADGALSSSKSTIRGDVGTNNGSYSGTPTLYGTKHVGDTTAKRAAKDVVSAYNDLAGTKCDSALGKTLGGGQILPPMVYCLGSASSLTGKLILDAKGDPNAIFIFKIDGAFSTGTYSEIVLRNGASFCNVYWQVNGAFTLKDSSIFRGTLIANGAISLLDGAILYGRALSKVGAITLVNNYAAIGVNPKVSITGGSASICSGTSLKLAANITIGNAPYTYSWTPSGSTTSSITVTPTTTTTYGVSITAIDGCQAAKDSVKISVNTPPSITSHPKNQTKCAGDSASFSVTATGSNLTYQWRKGINRLNNGGAISGATSATLKIKSVFAAIADSYNVIVSGTCSPNDTSNYAYLKVDSLPNIYKFSSDQTVCEGAKVTLTASATGTKLTYQWRKGTTLLNDSGNISGTKTPSLVINNAKTKDQASNYNVVVTGTCSPTATSGSITVGILTYPKITVEPTNKVACLNKSTSFSVTATGSGLKYQWKRGSTNLSNTNGLSGTTTNTLTINPVDSQNAAKNYHVIVSGTCPVKDTSNFVSLTLCTMTDIEDNTANNSAIIELVKMYPNPFNNQINIQLTDVSLANQFQIRIFNSIGVEIINTNLTKELTTIETGNLPSGIYFYNVIKDNVINQSGKLIAR